MAKSKTLIINDETPDSRLWHPAYADREGRGLELPPPEERSYAGVAEPFPAELRIPRSEWQARIQERQEKKATLRGMIQRAGVKVKNQQQTNYCWINAPTFCVEVIRLLQGQKYVELSPASAGARIKNFRNVGGWGKEGLEFIVQNGVAPVSLWPANAISKQYNTPATQQVALDYRADEWWVLGDRDVDDLISCLLRGFPVAVGYSWWGHEVTGVDALWVDGAIALQIANSWGDWGDQGYGILQGNRMVPDDAVAPRTALAS